MQKYKVKLSSQNSGSNINDKNEIELLKSQVEKLCESVQYLCGDQRSDGKSLY